MQTLEEVIDEINGLPGWSETDKRLIISYVRLAYQMGRIVSKRESIDLFNEQVV